MSMIGFLAEMREDERDSMDQQQEMIELTVGLTRELGMHVVRNSSKKVLTSADWSDQGVYFKEIRQYMCFDIHIS